MRYENCPSCGEDHQDDNEFAEKQFFPGLQEFYIGSYVYMKSPEPGGVRALNGSRKFLYLKNPTFEWSCVLTSDSYPGGENSFNPRLECDAPQFGVSFTCYSTGSFNWDSWHSLELHVGLNTPGVADGLAEIWLDSNPILPPSVSCTNGAHPNALNMRGGHADGLSYFGVGMQADRNGRVRVLEYRYWDDIVISTSGPIGSKPHVEF